MSHVTIHRCSKHEHCCSFTISIHMTWPLLLGTLVRTKFGFSYSESNCTTLLHELKAHNLNRLIDIVKLPVRKLSNVYQTYFATDLKLQLATGTALFMICKSRVKRQKACRRHAYLNYCPKSELNISPFTSHHYYYYLTFFPLLSIATCVWKARKMLAFCVGYFLFSFSVSSWMTQKYYE